MAKNKKNKNNNNKDIKNTNKNTINDEKKQLYAKLGITEDVINNDDYFIKAAKDKINESKIEVKKTKEEIDADIGWKNPKVLLMNALYGLFMAFSDAVPGYSGGTTLSIIGFYDRLINGIKNIFKPEIPGTRWKYLLWSLPFLVVWISLLVAFLVCVHFISEANQGVILVFLFATFSFCSIPFFFLTNKNNLPSYLTKFSEFSTSDKIQKKKNITNLVLIILGFLILLVISIVIRFVPQLGGGVTFIKNINESFDYSNFDMGNVLTLLVSGFLAGFFMLVPGISGSLMLYLTGSYSNVSTFIADLPGRFANGIKVVEAGESIPYLVIIIVAGIFGFISSILVINWIKKRFYAEFYSLSFGFVLASFISILIALSSKDYATLSNPLTLGLSIGMIVIGFVFNFGILIALNQTRRINVPFLYIKTKKDKIAN